MSDATLALPQTSSSVSAIAIRRIVCVLLILFSAGMSWPLAQNYAQIAIDEPALTDSALAQLGIWIAGQSEDDAPTGFLAQQGKAWANGRGAEFLTEDAAIDMARWPLVLIFGGVLVCAGAALFGLLRGGVRLPLLIGVGLWTTALFLVPTIPAENFRMASVIMGLFAMMLAGFAASPVPPSRISGFLLVLAALLGGIETMKIFARENNYTISSDVSAFAYTVYETPEAALEALASGEIQVIVADTKVLQEAIGENASAFHLTANPGRDEYRLGLPVRPTMPGRLAFAARADNASNITGVGDLGGVNIGTISGDFAETGYLNAARSWVLLDLKIFNNLNLPHLETITEAFLQPARRNGEFLLARILAGNALYTWSEAALGFVSGALLGFLLGSVFAHSKLLERGLLPYVIASQTVPILAIAPMVVIWLGAGPASVAVISAYLTFFPVTINTLRGLTSPQPMQVDLMRSYAASRWTIYKSLRLPAAVPYIFTALKVSATASVVGAIIGELPSSIRDGLARAILDFSGTYSEVSTPKLYAAIISAAAVGILFFAIVSLVERFALKRFIPHSE